MVADLRKMQENQGFSENRNDKLEFDEGENQIWNNGVESH